jgi:hypothetical protein
MAESKIVELLKARGEPYAGNPDLRYKDLQKINERISMEKEELMMLIALGFCSDIRYKMKPILLGMKKGEITRYPGNIDTPLIAPWISIGKLLCSDFPNNWPGGKTLDDMCTDIT